MLKRSVGYKATGGNAKRCRGPPLLQHLAVKGTWTDAIDSADLEECREIGSELSILLARATDRVDKLEKEDLDRGLSYEGKDAIICDCGNTFKSKGAYGAFCNADGHNGINKEKCIKCVGQCVACGIHLCKTCSDGCCSSCGEEPFCKECLTACNDCGEMVCGRSDSGNEYCETFSSGCGGGNSVCKGCAQYMLSPG